MAGGVGERERPAAGRLRRTLGQADWNSLQALGQANQDPATQEAPRAVRASGAFSSTKK